MYASYSRCEGCGHFRRVYRVERLRYVAPGGYFCVWCQRRIDPYVRDPWHVWNHAAAEGAYR